MFLTQPGVFTTTWITAITSMWIFALFLGQMGLIAAETSTFEVSEVSSSYVGVYTQLMEL